MRKRSAVRSHKKKHEEFLVIECGSANNFTSLDSQKGNRVLARGEGALGFDPLSLVFEAEEKPSWDRVKVLI